MGVLLKFNFNISENITSEMHIGVFLSQQREGLMVRRTI